MALIYQYPKGEWWTPEVTINPGMLLFVWHYTWLLTALLAGGQ